MPGTEQPPMTPPAGAEGAPFDYTSGSLDSAEDMSGPEAPLANPNSAVELPGHSDADLLEAMDILDKNPALAAKVDSLPGTTVEELDDDDITIVEE